MHKCEYCDGTGRKKVGPMECVGGKTRMVSVRCEACNASPITSKTDLLRAIELLKTEARCWRSWCMADQKDQPDRWDEIIQAIERTEGDRYARIDLPFTLETEEDR